MLKVLRWYKGKKEEINFSKYNPNTSFGWVYCTNVGTKELEKIHEKLNIPLYELKHVMDKRERPRIFICKEYCLIILRGIVEGKAKVTSPIEFIISKKFVLTLMVEDNDSIDKVFDEIDLNALSNLSKGKFGPLLYRVLFALINDYSVYLIGLDNLVEKLEDSALRASESDMENLFLLKRKLLYLRRSLLANKEAIVKLDDDWFKDDYSFHDLHTEVNQVVNFEEIMRDRITSVLEIYFTSVSNRLNEVMKSFTVIASLLLLPMLVSGVYGMNIVLPYQQHPQAFLIVIAIMVIFMALMVLFFKAKKWL